MTLVIAEKPSLAKDIASALPGTETKVGNDYYECGSYIITWLFGHVLTLKDPEDYDVKFKERNNVSLLPIYFKNWETKIADSDKDVKKNRVVLIGKLLKTAECVIHAGDPDEEGQLLVDEVLRWHNYKGKVLRLDTRNTTKEALQKALKKMTDNDIHANEGWSAYARSVADFMVGINLTRYFSAMNKMHLPFGRVKIPTLGLVVARDAIIESHKESEYYEVNGNVNFGKNGIVGKYIPAKADTNIEDGRILSKSYAESKRKLMDGYEGKVTVSKNTTSAQPPLPFNLVKLQSYCSAQFGLTPSQTLDITQKLRTEYHAITYNRSDCQYLSEEHYKEAPKTVAATLANLGVTYTGLDTKIKSKCFNDSAITAHFAIIPSGQRLDISKLSATELKVYQAICKYYLIQFMPNAKKERANMSVPLSDGATVEANSTIVTFEGYLSVLHGEKKSEEEEKSALSSIPAGTYNSKITDAVVVTKKTKPPARYTKASLNEDMTRIAKYVDDPKVKALLLEKDKDKKGENGSIGTSATRATIIDDLIKLEYVREDGKKLISTPKGREYYKILPDEFKKPDMTAFWWVIQEDIKNGIKTPQDLAESVLASINRVLHNKYPLLTKFTSETGKEVVGECPVCGGDVIETHMGFSCQGVKGTVCPFIIWKKPVGSLFKDISISKTQAKNLLAGKDVDTVKLYSEKTKRHFPGKLRLDVNPEYKYGTRLTVDFNPSASAKCPCCGGDIIEFEKMFRCKNNPASCKFVVWKRGVPGSLFSKLLVSKSMLNKLLNGETVSDVTLFSKNKNKTFSGNIYLQINETEKTAEIRASFE